MGANPLPKARCVLIALASLALSLTASPLVAASAADGCSNRDELTKFLSSQLPASNVPYRVVTFNHRTGRPQYWKFEHPDDSDTGKLDPLTRKPDFETRFDGQAILTVPRKAPFVTVITNTNPVLYRAEAGKVERVDIEEFKALKKAAGLALGFASAAVEADVERGLLELHLREQSAESFGAVEPCSGLTPDDLRCLVSRVIGNLPTTPGLADLKSGMMEVKENVDKAEDLGERFFAALQETESGNYKGVELPDLQSKLPPQDALRTAFDELAAALKPLEDLKLPCYDAATTILPLFSDALSLEPPAVRWDRRIVAADKALEGCSDQDAKDNLKALVQWFQSYGPPGTEDPSPKMTQALRDGIVSLGRVAGVSQSFAAVLKQAKELLDTRAGATKELAALHLIKTRVAEARAQNPLGDCLADLPRWLACGMIELERKTVHDLDLPFFRTQKESFSVATVETLSSHVTLRSPKKTDFSYTLQRPTRVALGVDTGVIWTDLSDPTFGAVEKEKTDPTTGEMETVKVIDRTDEDSLAGELAVFFSLTPAALRERPWKIGGQVGFGLDDNPSLLVGLKAQWRALVVGGGIMWHEVTKLVDGQQSFHEVGLDGATEVSGDGDIKTTSSFPSDFYFTISVSVNELPFFGD